jgi:hypothetical protein
MEGYLRKFGRMDKIKVIVASFEVLTTLSFGGLREVLRNSFVIAKIETGFFPSKIHVTTELHFSHSNSLLKFTCEVKENSICFMEVIIYLSSINQSNYSISDVSSFFLVNALKNQELFTVLIFF